MIKEGDKFKICRQCHTIYRKLTQKFCGNGCSNKSPYFIEGKINKNIEDREVILTSNSENKIRWMCIACKKEYYFEKIISKSKCECGMENDFYPFTIKECANSDCKIEDKYHRLPLEAKACDLCGKSNFLLNENKLVSELKKNILHLKEEWQPTSIEFKDIKTKKAENKNQTSITFKILNNNLEYILYGSGKNITMYDIIRDSNGFVPDSIYNKLLKKYPKDTKMFNIIYNRDEDRYSLQSVLVLKMAELDTNYSPISEPIIRKAETEIELPESKLLLFQSGFFKMQIWVY